MRWLSTTNRGSLALSGQPWLKMSGSAAASIEEFIELLNAEQHVDLPKLRDYARHGVQPTVRGEVWLYLLGVLSDDKSQEMTSVRSKYIEYDSLDKHNLLYEKRIRNEAVRYYQRRLIPRPPPGRTLARSSQRIAQQNSHSNSSGSMGVALASGMSAPLSTSVAKAATTMRGPNRVDNGQTHVLAGIMGDSSTGPTNLLHPSESDDVLLIDPQAAAANEMKRFCQAVENIVCAHLNRWTWCSIDGKVKIVEPRREEEPQDDSIDMGDSSQSFHSPDQTSHTAAQQHGQRPVSPGSDGLKSSPGSYLAPPEHITRARSSTASSSYSSASSIEESREQAGVASSSSPFPSLPKEYEWAHQIGEAPTSVVRMVDESEVEHHQGHFIQPEYHPDLILLCSPFVKCIRSEAGMFFAFERLMSIIGWCSVRQKHRFVRVLTP